VGVKVSDEMVETMAKVMADMLCSTAEASGIELDEDNISRLATAAIASTALLRDMNPEARDFLMGSIPMLEAALSKNSLKKSPLKKPMAVADTMEEILKAKGNKPGTVVAFTPDKLKRLKAEYQKAKDENLSSFMFDGNEFETGYAKHTIEFMEAKFKEMGHGRPNPSDN
jgi:hypothetical protein